MSSDCVAVPADTSLEVWRLYVAGIRALTPAQRLAEAERFTSIERRAEIDYLRRRFPDLERGQFAVEVVRYRYGNELAEAVSSRLLARKVDSINGA